MPKIWLVSSSWFTGDQEAYITGDMPCWLRMGRAKMGLGTLDKVGTVRGENLFLKGVNNLPLKDIEKVFNITSEGEEPTQEKVTHLAQMLTFNLLANRICEQCGDKRDLTKLSICGSCALAWYCSKECQERHWSTHKLRCCKKDGPLNTGYQAIAMVKMK